MAVVVADPIVAVEIGTSKICALVGEAREDGQIMLIGKGHCPSRGVRKSLVFDLALVSSCVREAIHGAEQSGQVEIGKVFLVVSGEHIRSMTNQGSVPVADPPSGVTPDDIEQVMDIARAVNLPHDRELVHSIPRKYVVDDQLTVANPEGMRGAKLSLDMLLVHGMRTMLTNAVQAAHNVGLDVADVAFSGLCAAMATLTPEQKERGVALLDLGAGTTSYLVYADGAVALAGVLAVGGDHITNDISIAFSISLKRAETLKQKAGSVMPDANMHFQQLAVPAEVGFPACSVAVSDLSAVIRSRMAETFGLLAELLKEHRLSSQLGAGLVLTGGGVHLKGIVALAEQIFDLPCLIGQPVNFSGMALADEGPDYAAPLGMLRYAVRSGAYRRAERISLGGLLGKLLGRS
ncbi:MAG: cell division protein FtsA [Lentisphaerae bacterium]|nr:cell division protein FtsA [Lentisphaerota bacterium]